MVNKQTVLNIALMVVIIIMGTIIVMQNEQIYPVVEQPVCPVIQPCAVCNTTIETVYIEKPCVEKIDLVGSVQNISSPMTIEEYKDSQYKPTLDLKPLSTPLSRY